MTSRTSDYVRQIRKRDTLNHSNFHPAGVTSERGRGRFRCGLVIQMEPLLTYRAAHIWNHPESRQYSQVPAPVIGLPYDHSKPRRGRWGEILGTKISDMSAPIEYIWNEKMSRLEREQKALEEAKADLQRRIEICLYGKPRDPPVQPPCVLGPDGIYRKSEQRL